MSVPNHNIQTLQQQTHEENMREAGLMTTTGVQGVGKTYQNMHLIADYVQDKIDIKVKGRKVLIFDTNGEYTPEEFRKNGITNIVIKTIALSDIEPYSYSNLIEVRRIDAKHLGISEKKAILEYLLKVFKNGLLVVEDINTYVLSLTHMEEVVGRIVNLRHRAVDCLISYQSLRPVEPRIWQNSRWVRMHFQADDVDDVKGKVTNPELYKIAQLMVNHRYINDDERFFCYITKFGQKIEGRFKKPEFIQACTHYLHLHNKKVQQHMNIYKVDEQTAYTQLCNFYVKRYYDNPDKNQ